MRDSQVLLDPEVHAVDKWVVASALEVSGLDLLHDSQTIIIFADLGMEEGKMRFSACLNPVQVDFFHSHQSIWSFIWLCKFHLSGSSPFQLNSEKAGTLTRGLNFFWLTTQRIFLYIIQQEKGQGWIGL